jgi:hypothetical protein
MERHDDRQRDLTRQRDRDRLPDRWGLAGEEGRYSAESRRPAGFPLVAGRWSLVAGRSHPVAAVRPIRHWGGAVAQRLATSDQRPEPAAQRRATSDLRRAATRRRLPIAPIIVLASQLTGCGGNVNLFGIYFAPWMACVAGGAIAGYATTRLLERYVFDYDPRYFAWAFLALTILFSFVLWFVWVRN